VKSDSGPFTQSRATRVSPVRTRSISCHYWSSLRRKTWVSGSAGWQRSCLEARPRIAELPRPSIRLSLKIVTGSSCCMLVMD